MLNDEGDHFCDCYLGWTGKDCGTDCQCNKHSMCEDGTGKCDFCLNGTTGKFCDQCLDGHYGEPTKPEGIFPVALLLSLYQTIIIIIMLPL